MTTRSWHNLARLIGAALTAIALGYQLIHLHNTKPDFRTANFFSFFTVESNIFAAVVLVIAVWRESRGQSSPTFDLVRGAAVLYMATTGVVYGLLLSGYQEELQTTIPWVDTVVHRIMPLVLVADWLIDPPRSRIGWPRAARWLIYPALYMIYSLVRGPIVDWYPYPFLDPDQAGGYGAVALYCVGIAIGISLFATIVAALSRRQPAPVLAGSVGRGVT